VAAWFPNMICNFYSVKKWKNANSSSTGEAREKLSKDFESVKFQENLYSCLTKLRNNQTL
jgi:hypothetical protein